MIRAALLLAALLACAAPLGPGAPEPAGAQAPGPAPAPADSFARFLEALADSTDARFGASTDFDTLGLDTLEATALERPVEPPRLRRAASTYPVAGFHRALGASVGAGRRAGSTRLGVFDLRGSYATSARLGRHAFTWRRTLWAPGPPRPAWRALRPGRIGEGTRLDLELRHAREDLAFMPEHAVPGWGAFAALVSGAGAQSIFESRGGAAGLTLWSGDWRLGAGARFARERSLGVATRFSLLGDDGDVAANTAAADDEWTEPWGGIAFHRSDWDLGATLDARGGGRDRWRLRAALGKGLRLGPDLKLATQVEAGAAAALAPRQRRFELGGPLAVPTLPYGRGGGDHLLLGRAELVAAADVLASLGLPHPDWLVLQPSLFVDGGNVWDDPGGRDVVLSTPPSTGWRGAAGGGFAWRLGVPEPDVTLRLWMAWPIGANAGVPRFSAALGRSFELLGRL